MKMIAGVLDFDGNEVNVNWCFLAMEFRELYSASIMQEGFRQMEQELGLEPEHVILLEED